jgi:hypothetical protein
MYQEEGERAIDMDELIVETIGKERFEFVGCFGFV